MENFNLDDLSARDYMRVLFKHAGLIFMIFFVSVISMTAYSYLVLPTYETEAKLLLVAQQDVPMPLSQKLNFYRPGIEIGVTQAEVIKSHLVLANVVEALDLHHRPDPTGIRGRVFVAVKDLKEWFSDFKQGIKDRIYQWITKTQPEPREKGDKIEKEIKHLMSEKVVKIQPIERTDVISIKASDYDPKMAVKIANAIAQTYIIYNMDMKLEDLRKVYREEHPRIVNLKDDIEHLRADLKTGTLRESRAGGNDAVSDQIKVLQKAFIPQSPVLPKKMINIGLAAVVSLFVGIGLVFLIEAFDQSVKSAEDVSRSAGAKLLGSMPGISAGRKARGPFVVTSDMNGKSTGFTQNLRTIASEILFMKRDGNVKTIMITSAEDGVGKSTFAINLATTLAAITKSKVLLVDADLRHSSMNQAFLTSREAGLSDVYGKQLKWRELVTQEPSKQLSFMSAGTKTEHPEGFFTSHEAKDFFREAKSEYDFVIVDTPGLKRYRDALCLSGAVDGAVFLVGANRTRKQLLRLYKNALTEKNIPILGVVMNFRKLYIPEAVYNRL